MLSKRATAGLDGQQRAAKPRRPEGRTEQRRALTLVLLWPAAVTRTGTGTASSQSPGICSPLFTQLELRDVIERVGRDLWAHFGPEDPVILLPMRSHAEVTAVRAG